MKNFATFVSFGVLSFVLLIAAPVLADSPTCPQTNSICKVNAHDCSDNGGGVNCKEFSVYQFPAYSKDGRDIADYDNRDDAEKTAKLLESKGQCIYIGVDGWIPEL